MRPQRCATLAGLRGWLGGAMLIGASAGLAGCPFYDPALLPPFEAGPAGPAAAVDPGSVGGVGLSEAKPAAPPLLVIPFGAAEADYAAALAGRVRDTLAADPNAVFALVAVLSAEPGDPRLDVNSTRRALAGVAGTLTRQGVQPERLLLSAKTLPEADEDTVQVYRLELR